MVADVTNVFKITSEEIIDGICRPFSELVDVRGGVKSSAVHRIPAQTPHHLQLYLNTSKGMMEIDKNNLTSRVGFSTEDIYPRLRDNGSLNRLN